MTRHGDDEEAAPRLRRRTPRAAGERPADPAPDQREWRKVDIKSPIDVLIPGGGISMITGATGVGKSAFLSTMIARLLALKTIFGFTPAPTLPFIGLVITDRRWSTARRWLDRAGVEESDRFRAYCLLDDPTFDWKEARKESSHAELFSNAIDVLAPPPQSLLFFDPIALYLGRRLGDYSETAAAIGQLNAVCVRKRITVIGTSHVKKASRDEKESYLRPQDRALGSTAIPSYTNTQIYIVGPEETKKVHYLIGYVSHDLPPAEFTFTRGTEGLFVPMSQEEVERIEAEKAIEADTDEVFNAIPGPEESPMPAKRIVQIASMHNISRSAIYRRLDKWKDAGLIEQPTEGFWRRTKGGH